MRRAAAAALAVLLAALPAAPSRAAADVMVECEDFEAYGSNDLGGVPIAPVLCTGASGYLAVDGLDLLGEWILLSVNIPSPGCYNSTLAYQAAYDDDVGIRVSVIDAPVQGDEIDVDYPLTNGWGFG